MLRWHAVDMDLEAGEFGWSGCGALGTRPPLMSVLIQDLASQPANMSRMWALAVA